MLLFIRISLIDLWNADRPCLGVTRGCCTDRVRYVPKQLSSLPPRFTVSYIA